MEGAHAAGDSASNAFSWQDAWAAAQPSDAYAEYAQCPQQGMNGTWPAPSSSLPPTWAAAPQPEAYGYDEYSRQPAAATRAAPPPTSPFYGGFDERLMPAADAAPVFGATAAEQACRGHSAWMGPNLYTSSPHTAAHSTSACASAMAPPPQPGPFFSYELPLSYGTASALTYAQPSAPQLPTNGLPPYVYGQPLPMGMSGMLPPQPALALRGYAAGTQRGGYAGGSAFQTHPHSDCLPPSMAGCLPRRAHSACASDSSSACVKLSDSTQKRRRAHASIAAGASGGDVGSAGEWRSRLAKGVASPPSVRRVRSAPSGSKKGPEFTPVRNLPPAREAVYAEGEVPKGSSILIIKQPWIGLILDGRKTLEIRGHVCRKPQGERIYLAQCGAGGIVVGSAVFKGCLGPLSKEMWEESKHLHCIDTVELPYGGSTYAWQLESPVRFIAPVTYKHKSGIIIWARME